MLANVSLRTRILVLPAVAAVGFIITLAVTMASAAGPSRN